MRAIALELKHELIGLAGVVERNVYLTRRYIWWDLAFFVWTVANTLTIVFIAEGIEATGGSIDVDRATTTLLIGAVVWAYLGIIFEFLTETVAWERWEGTIEYTSWRRCRGRCTSADPASSPCCTGSSGQSCSSSSWRRSSASHSTTPTSSRRSSS
jgi:ABC-2 type transport system permease protein